MANKETQRSSTFGSAAPKKRGSMSATNAALISAAAIAGGVYFWADAQQNKTEADLDASTVSAFQNGGNASGRVVVPKEEIAINTATKAVEDALSIPNAVVAPTPQTAPRQIEVTAKQDEQTKAELKALREALVTNAQNRDAALQTALTEMKKAFDDQKAATEQNTARLEQENRELASKLNTAEALRATEEAARAALEAQLEQSELQKAAAKEQEQALREAEELARAQVKSPSVLYSAGNGAQSATNQGTGNGAGYKASANEAFLSQAPTLKVDTAERMHAPERTLAQGSVVQAVLQTAINSDLPGNVIAVVSEPVPSYAGESILIPRGSKLFGSYKSDIEVHQKRILIAWSRILTPDGISMQISAVGGDRLGRSGLTGFVDARFDERFGGAALISLIGAGPAIAAGQIRNTTASDVLESLAEDLQDATTTVMAEQLSVAPTIYVDQGASVTVLVDRDVVVY